MFRDIRAFSEHGCTQQHTIADAIAARMINTATPAAAPGDSGTAGAGSARGIVDALPLLMLPLLLCDTDGEDVKLVLKGPAVEVRAVAPVALEATDFVEVVVELAETDALGVVVGLDDGSNALGVGVGVALGVLAVDPLTLAVMLELTVESIPVDV